MHLLFRKLSPCPLQFSLIFFTAFLWAQISLATNLESITIYYNETCTASLAQDSESALSWFQKALDAGFDDFHFALSDPDLHHFTQTTAFKNLFLAHQSKMTLLSSERGFNLQSFQWSGWKNLGTGDDNSSIRLQWQPTSLEMEIQLTGEIANAIISKPFPPWQGGPGVMVTLAIPDGTSSFESGNTFIFAFGKNKTSGMGALFLGPQLGWQTIGELTPEIIENPQETTVLIRASISWQSLLPFHPLVDSPIGINVAQGGYDSTSDPMALFPDPHAFSPQSKIHRYVPIHFATSTSTREALVGRLSHSLLSNQPLDFDLKLVSGSTGTGKLKINFLDTQGRSVLPDGATNSSISLQSGMNSYARSADFRPLAAGPYLIKIDCETPSGTQLTWSSQLLNLGPQWANAWQDSIGKLSPLDQPTAQFYLDTVKKSAHDLPLRRHPGAMTTTFQQMKSLIQSGISEKSILPVQGALPIVWVDSQGKSHTCSMYLPEGHNQSKNLQPVIVWANAAGMEPRLTGRIARLFEHKDGPVGEKDPSRSPFPIYLVPNRELKGTLSLSEEISYLEEFQLWASRYFNSKTSSLVAVDSAVPAALDFIKNNSDQVSRLLVFAGGNLNADNLKTSKEISNYFSGGNIADVPITWLDFILETRAKGQAKLILSVLLESKYNVTVQEVRGGLSMTQISDRLVLWAEQVTK
ncbi:MAG: hypothetical protein GY780_11900 [bacterium]|nr:hypothetical protein [bacterium]